MKRNDLSNEITLLYLFQALDAPLSKHVGWADVSPVPDLDAIIPDEVPGMVTVFWVLGEGADCGPPCDDDPVHVWYVFDYRSTGG